MLCSKNFCDWYNIILLWNDSIKENCRLVLKVSRLYITEGESPWRKYWWSSFQYTHSGHGTPPTHSGHPMASWLVAMYTCLNCEQCQFLCIVSWLWQKPYLRTELFKVYRLTNLLTSAGDGDVLYTHAWRETENGWCVSYKDIDCGASDKLTRIRMSRLQTVGSVVTLDLCKVLWQLVSCNCLSKCTWGDYRS